LKLVSFGVEKNGGDQVASSALKHYGASAPAKSCLSSSGFTVDNIVDKARELLGQHPLKKRKTLMIVALPVTMEDFGSSKLYWKAIEKAGMKRWTLVYPQQNGWIIRIMRRSLAISSFRVKQIGGSSCAAPVSVFAWLPTRSRVFYAGLCHDTYSAHQGVEHDNMNVLCWAEISSGRVGEGAGWMLL